MRTIIATCFLMTVLLWLGCVIDVPVNLGSTRTMSSHSEVKADLEWRRTKDGWEKKSSWGLQQSNRRAPSAAVTVHPLVISLLELFLVSATFVARAPSRQFAGPIAALKRLIPYARVGRQTSCHAPFPQ